VRGAPSTSSEKSGPKATASATSSLLAESEGVQQVQQALAGGNAARALTLLETQGSQFGTGALAEERAALRVLALCAAGQPEAAEVARQRFLRTYPHSPHEARVRGNCTRQ
jgi:outer membrane protein assembly factor BamD (BamD/ComL family)